MQFILWVSIVYSYTSGRIPESQSTKNIFPYNWKYVQKFRATQIHVYKRMYKQHRYLTGPIFLFLRNKSRLQKPQQRIHNMMCIQLQWKKDTQDKEIDAKITKYALLYSIFVNRGENFMSSLHLDWDERKYQYRSQENHLW